MLGKRFSIAAFPLAAAGVCSVLLCSTTVLGQSYQQTKFPKYGTQPYASRATQATRATPLSSGPQRANDIFAPSTLNLGSLPEAKQPPVRVAKAALQSVFETPLTNTQYSRGKLQGNVMSNPFANTAFAKDKASEFTAPPELPDFKSPIAQLDTVESFDQIPLDITSPRPSSQSTTSAQADEPLLLAPAEPSLDITPAEPRASLQAPSLPRAAENSANEISGSLSRVEAPSADETFRGLSQGEFQDLSPSQNQSQDQNEFQTQTQDPSLDIANQQSGTQNRQPQFVQPRTVQPQYSQPQYSQPQYQELTQPTYFQSSPHYAQQASGPTSNEWGYGYPEANLGVNQAYVETPYNIQNHGFGSFNTPSNTAQRSVQPTVRNRTIADHGESFDFETKKKEFPPFGEIIATGRFFGSVEVASLRPHFLGNTAISIDGPSFSESIPFEFANEEAPQLRFGFESKFGPGVELNYFNINANSRGRSETFDGVAPITSIASITGPNRFSQLSADAIGETLNVNHSFEIETYSFNVFKEIQFPVSRINGRFGFTYANIAQSLETSVTDTGDNVLDSLESTSDFRGFGPKFGIDYYRPIGHTPLEFVTSMTGTGIFGRRDQFVNNTAGLVERRFGADEFVTVIDFNSGIQYKKTTGENRSWFARISFNHQSWLGGGTAVDPTGDFGLKGFLFGVGFNR